MLCCFKDLVPQFLSRGSSVHKALQWNLDYPDSLGPHEIVRIIEGPDNRKYVH